MNRHAEKTLEDASIKPLKNSDIQKLMELGKNSDVAGIQKLVKELIKKNLDSTKANKEKQEREAYLEMYRDLFSGANVGIGFSDITSNTIEQVNPFFCSLLEISQEDIVGKDISDFFSRHILNKEDYKKGKEIFKKEGELSAFELLFKTTSGKEIWLLVSSRRIKKLSKEFFTVMDITALKALEVANNEKIATLHKLDDERSYMVNVMTHEIIGPLVASIGFCNRIYRKGNLAEPFQEILKLSIDELKKMERLALNNLDITKMERGEYEVRPESINLLELINSIFGRFEILYKDKGVTINSGQHLLLDELDIIGDKHWLEHLFYNLLKNAYEESFKHNAKNINILMIEESNDVIVYINNIGVIPDNLKDKLFKERYVESGKAGGNGIGSYFSSMIAKIHKGQIFIDSSSESTGTTIGVRLPKNCLSKK